MKQAEFMDQLVYDLIEYYEAEVLPSGLIYLELSMYGYGVLVIEEKIKHKQMCVCYWLYDGQGHPVPEPEVTFYIDAGGHWIPYEIRRHTLGNHSFADLDLGDGDLLILDAKHQEALAAFADLWAETLRAQGWIGGADKAPPQSQPWPDEDPPHPPLEDLWDWVDEYGKCTATDGCWVDPTEVCEHGHKSWLVELGELESARLTTPVGRDDL